MSSLHPGHASEILEQTVAQRKAVSTAQGMSSRPQGAGLSRERDRQRHTGWRAAGPRRPPGSARPCSSPPAPPDDGRPSARGSVAALSWPRRPVPLLAERSCVWWPMSSWFPCVLLTATCHDPNSPKRFCLGSFQQQRRQLQPPVLAGSVLRGASDGTRALFCGGDVIGQRSVLGCVRCSIP